jgi:hypothetical protein
MHDNVIVWRDAIQGRDAVHGLALSPNRPNNVGTSIETDCISVMWTLCSEWNIVGYNIYRKENTSTEFECIASVNRDVNIYVDMDIDDDVIYWYKITAVTELFGLRLESDIGLPVNHYDVTGDGVVDVDDYNMVVNLFGMPGGSSNPLWILYSMCDVNGDYVIDTLDAGLVQAAYGLCP